jgi:hypothetical protein
MSEPAVRQRGDRAVFGVVFLMLFAFSYSEQLVSGLFPVVGGGGHTAWRVAVVVVDAAVLGLVGQIKASSPGRPRCATTMGLVVDGRRHSHRCRCTSAVPGVVRLDVLTATVYAVAMGLTMAASLNADPLALFSTARRVALPTDWMRVRAIVPLVLGAWLCYLAASVRRLLRRRHHAGP